MFSWEEGGGADNVLKEFCKNMFFIFCPESSPLHEDVYPTFSLMYVQIAFTGRTVSTA